MMSAFGELKIENEIDIKPLELSILQITVIRLRMWDLVRVKIYTHLSLADVVLPITLTWSLLTDIKFFLFYLVLTLWIDIHLHRCMKSYSYFGEHSK